MTIDERSKVLRAMRAWLDADQSAAAAGAGLSTRTLIMAERAEACSDKTWARLIGWFDQQGLEWVAADADAPPMIVIHAD